MLFALIDSVHRGFSLIWFSPAARVDVGVGLTPTPPPPASLGLSLRFRVVHTSGRRDLLELSRARTPRD